MYIPTARYANLGYLKKPLKHSYEDFIDNRPLGRTPLSFSLFNRNIPKNMKHVSKTHFQCTCEKCDNIKKDNSKANWKESQWSIMEHKESHGTKMVSIYERKY